MRFLFLVAKIACFYTLKGLTRETQKMFAPAVPSVAVFCNFPDDLWNSRPPKESCSFLYYFSTFSGFIIVCWKGVPVQIFVCGTSVNLANSVLIRE
jgi:hypothetical protein